MGTGEWLSELIGKLTKRNGDRNKVDKNKY